MALVDLDELRTFVQVVDSRSLTAAARALGVTKNAISRRLMRLEERVGARLVQRSTRRLAPTDDGLCLYRDGVAILRAADEAQDRIDRRAAGLRGVVKLATPEYFARLLTRHLYGLLDDHPGLSVQIVVDDHPVSLVGDALDIAVTVGPLPDSALVARRIGVVPAVMAASTAYLRRRGAPSRPEDLASHECLCFVGGLPQTRWRLVAAGGRHRDVAVSGRLASTSSELLRLALEAGYGIGLVHPAELTGRDDLQRVLPAYEVAPFEVFAVFAAKQRRSPRIRAVLALLERVLPEDVTGSTSAPAAR